MHFSTSVEYRGLPDSLERDIFQRVQLGVPLTAGEKLQAHTSPRADYITQLVSSFIISDVDMGIAEYVEFDTSRGRGFQAVAQMSYCCNNLPRQHFPSGRQLDEWLKKNEMPGDAFKGALEESLGMFKVIASTPGLNAGFKEVKNRVAPAEFVFIGKVFVLYNARYNVLIAFKVFYYTTCEAAIKLELQIPYFRCAKAFEQHSRTFARMG